MGIPQFIRTINSLYNVSFLSINNVDKKIGNTNSNIMIDFNSFIHDAFNNYQKMVFTEIKTIISENKYDDNELADYIKNINQQLNNTVTNKVIDDLNIYIKKMPFSKKKVFLFIDGIPPFAKIVEQLKRSFIGIIEKNYENKIFMDSITEPDDPIVGYYEAKKEVRELSITPSDKIMNMITSKLKTDMPTVEIVDHTMYGEGEAKLVKFIKNRKLDNCIVVSPDADLVILLSLLFVNHGQNNLYLTKKTSDRNDVLFNTCIDISKLCDSIFTFYNDIEGTNIKNIINDLCFIFSFLGNDFIPGNFYFNANDLLIFIKMYEKYLLDYPTTYIILYEGERYSLNIDQLYIYIGFLKEYEHFSQMWYNIKNKYLNVPIDMLFLKSHFGINPSNLDNSMLDPEMAHINFKPIENEFVNTFIYNSLKNEYQFENTNDEQKIVKSLAIFKSSIGSDNKKFMGFIDEKLGLINIDNANSLTYQEQNIVNEYYHNLFFNGSNIGDVCNNYIEMLHWLVEYYYNFEYVDKTTSLCYYKYSQAPLLVSLYSYLDDMESYAYYKYKEGIANNVNSKQLSIEKYFDLNNYKIYRTYGGQFEKLSQTQINSNVAKMFPRIPFYDILGETQIFMSNVKCQGVRYLSNCKPQFIIDNIPDPIEFINSMKYTNTKNINSQELEKLLTLISNNKYRRHNIINLLN